MNDIMKDSDIKNLFANLKVPEAAPNFENRIIVNTLAKKPVFQRRRYAAVAALVMFIMSFSLMNFTMPEKSKEYANLVDDSAVIDEDDIYDDLIMAYNY